MEQYTIYCTQDQCDRASRLGAPIKKGEKVTAEQMVGWLDTKQVEVLVAFHSSFSFFTMSVNSPRKFLTHTHEYETRQEAVLKAIDFALDYLLGLPTGEQLPKDLKVGDCFILHEESTIFIKVSTVSDDSFTAELYSIGDVIFSHYREIFAIEDLDKSAVEISSDVFDRISHLYQEFVTQRDALLEQRSKEETIDLHTGDSMFFDNQDDENEVCRILSVEPKVSYEGLPCECSFQGLLCMKGTIVGKPEGLFMMPSGSFDKMKDLSCKSVQQAKLLTDSIYYIDGDGFGHLK